jgi:hypothetical protein
MLLGNQIIVKTDHKNLTHPLSTHASNRVLCQCLLLEEYGVDLEYIKGEKNIVADALSRLPISNVAETAAEIATKNEPVSDNVIDSETERTAAKMSDLVGLLSSLPTEELFVFNENDFPLNFNIIAEGQGADNQLQQELKLPNNKYREDIRDGIPLYVHSKHGSIYIPASLQFSILQWYHTTLQHPGIARMQATIKEHLYWPGIDDDVVKHVKKCQVCQQYKITAIKKYGKIPLPKIDTLLPWEEVHVDLMGLWPVQYTSPRNPSKTAIEKIQALTIVDKATGWPEFVAIKNKSSYHISLLFDSDWLCRYPRPRRVVYDNGTEFTGGEFQELLLSYGIKPVSTTVRNPKSNGVVERVHLTMGDMLCKITFSGEDWHQDLQRTLDAVAWAIRTTISPALKYSPCHLAFNQDMIFRKAVAVDWEKVQQECSKTSAASNIRENQARVAKTYQVGDQILIVLDADECRGQPKMNKPTRGPYTITKVHDNGTVTINRGNFEETINIRHIKPYITG